MATTGNLAPNCVGPTAETCSLGMRGYLWGFYIVLGVPLYALFFSRVVGLIISTAMDIRERKILIKPITDSEYYFAASFQDNFTRVQKFREGTYRDMVRLSL